MLTVHASLMPAQPRDPFSALLDQVHRRRDERESHVRLRPIGNPGFQVQIKDETFSPRQSLDELYDSVDPGEDGAPRTAPPTTTDPEEIARELGLPGMRTAEEVARARRRFALANHPDRLDPSQRETATRRMMVANQLLDAALARLP